jgi:hypothetical protein
MGANRAPDGPGCALEGGTADAAHAALRGLRVGADSTRRLQRQRRDVVSQASGCEKQTTAAPRPSARMNRPVRITLLPLATQRPEHTVRDSAGPHA